MESRVPDPMEKVRTIFSQSGFVRDLGIRLKEAGPGWCESALELGPKHTQQDGYVHAGVQATIADHTAGGAAATIAAETDLVLSVEFKINFLRPALGERLVCRASVLRQGRTLQVAESEVFAERGGNRKLVAKAMVTLALVPASSR